ncbi:queuosine precursor transporter [Nitratireductor soli]|uniref:queuosine precursor transporter n=1 Tax=Nitratireductor soli TaxID=1670619 RepID=UPI00065E8CA1|nr:queuosine precursor transporter [Nitratireductor soli]
MNRTLAIWPFVAAMAVIVVVSNILVQYPFRHFGLGEILTWGAFTYPVAFLVNDLTNRRFGPDAARRVVFSGFVLAVILSAWLASPRLAIASGAAFLLAQLLDVAVFDRLRGGAWWRAPLISTLIGSVLDTMLFFFLAFSARFAFLDTALGRPDGSLAFPVSLFGTGIEAPLWLSLALGDFAVKVLIGLLMLAPYGALLATLRPNAASGRN